MDTASDMKPRGCDVIYALEIVEKDGMYK